MITKRLPVGISDFKDMVTGNYYYVDKTLLIKEILDKGDKILLIPRPRRFGKTLNLSMLKYFYDCCPATWSPAAPPPDPAQETGLPDQGNRKLFASLAIANAAPQYLEHMGKFPVIFISFRDIKELEWETCLDKLKQLIQDEYAKHYYLLKSNALLPHERDYFQKILDMRGSKGDYEKSLEKLLIFLSRYYRQRAVILIDEYDAPVHAGFFNGYYEKVINFMRNFLAGGLKDTDPYLEKGVLTGIMRIAKESFFSGLNNPGVYTLLSEEFNQHFGFTEPELETLLKDFDLLHRYGEIQEWYNGYNFGGRIIYNPWSIINFLGSAAKELKPYWLNTSDNEIVETLLSKGGKELKEELEQLLGGDAIEKAIEENIVLKDIPLRENLLWSFLLMGGYLKQSVPRKDESSGKTYYRLTIPNKEVRASYTAIVENYFAMKIENKYLEIMLKALITGDIVLFEEMLQKVVAAVFSYHDFGDEPEKVYHALVAGLLVWISNTHDVKSNRESGYGRYDIMIIPRDVTQWGYVIEFKKTGKKETVKSAVKAALQQMEAKRYETGMVERGITRIKMLAIVFRGKEVFVKEQKS